MVGSRHFCQKDGENETMKYLSIMLLLVLVTVTDAPVASAQTVEFRGTLVLTSANPACREFGWEKGNTFTARFTPGGVGSNSFTGLSYFLPFFGENYEYNGDYRDLVGIFEDVFGTGVGRGGFTFTAQLRIDQVQPGNIKPDTEYVRMGGKIKNFNDIPGCNVNFRSAFNLRI